LSGLAVARAGGYSDSWVSGVAILGKGRFGIAEAGLCFGEEGSRDRRTTDQEKSMRALVRKTAKLGSAPVNGILKRAELVPAYDF
jgi:hypothetical protein